MAHVQAFKFYIGASQHVGVCQNYGPFLGPYIIRHQIFRVPKKGPTTHVDNHEMRKPKP